MADHIFNISLYKCLLCLALNLIAHSPAGIYRFKVNDGNIALWASKHRPDWHSQVKYYWIDKNETSSRFIHTHIHTHTHTHTHTHLRNFKKKNLQPWWKVPVILIWHNSLKWFQNKKRSFYSWTQKISVDTVDEINSCS